MPKNFGLSFLCFVVSIASAAAQSTPAATFPADTTTLAPITIAAAAKASQLSPFSFQNIAGRQLKQLSWGQEPALILQQTPSMTAYSDGGHSNGYAYFRLRGIDQTRINFSLDGMPLNDPEDQSFYFSNFPDFLQSIGNLQIQRGVGMSKHGAASYGGSLQFESPNQSDSLQLNMGIDYGSFHTYRVFGEFQSGTKRNTSFYLRLSQQHSDGYKHHTANTGQSAFAAFKWAKKHHALRLIALAGHQANNGLAWLGVTQSRIDADPRSNGNSPLETDNFIQALGQLQYAYYANRNLTLRAALYGTASDGSYTFDWNNFIGIPTSGDLYKYAFRAKMGGASLQASYEQNGHRLNIGINSYTYNRRHIGSEQTLGELYENTGYKQEATAFAQYGYRLKRWLLHAEAQYRYARFAYTGTAAIAPLTWHFLNPKAGISYQITPKHTLYYSIGTTGREPTRNDMFAGNDDLPTDSLGNALLGNTKPEYVTDHELGWRYQSTRYRINANVYLMQFRNEIILNGQFGPNGLALTNNVSRSFRSGVEIESYLELGKHLRLSHQAAFNYSRIKADSGGTDANFCPILTPAFVAQQTLSYHRKVWQVGLDIRYQSEAYIDFANDNTLPAFWTIGLNGLYTWRKWTAGLRLNNLLNTRYYSNGYIDFNGENRYFVQSPLHFTASLQWHW